MLTRSFKCCLTIILRNSVEYRLILEVRKIEQDNCF